MPDQMFAAAYRTPWALTIEGWGRLVMHNLPDGCADGPEAVEVTAKVHAFVCSWLPTIWEQFGSKSEAVEQLEDLLFDLRHADREYEIVNFQEAFYDWADAYRVWLDPTW